MKNIFKIVLLSSVFLLVGTLSTVAQSKKKRKKISSKKVVYVNKSPKITAIRHIPNSSQKITHKKSNYSLYKGKYYKTVEGRHILIAPPKGLRISRLPVGFIKINVGNMYYYHCEGVYYREVPDYNQFEVVEAPIGSLIYSLPQDAEVVIYNDKVYYEYHTVLYKKVETQQGEAFEVIGNLND